MSLRGVIRGRTIELDEPPPLPEGTRVEVDIKSPPYPDNPFWGRWRASADLIAEIEQTLMMARENTRGDAQMKKALIDTDIWLEIVRGVNPAVRAHANEYWATHGTFTLSVITVAEIVRGLVRQQRMDLLEQWRADAEQLEILPLDYASGELAGELYARLESAGVPIGRLDPLIAATALRYQLVLVTGNVRHFQRVAELGYPLEIVNWREAG